MKTNEEVIDYLAREVNDRIVSIIDYHLGLIVTCHVKSMFESLRSYKRVKAYLRLNGFSADGSGTHTRANDSKDSRYLLAKGYFRAHREFKKLKPI